MVSEAATDRDVFLAFIEYVLVPALQPGQIVILDSLSVHQTLAVRPLIEGAGCTLHFLPPYSPDLNPIEKAWSKLKALLRSATARTRAALHAALTAVLDQLTAADARAWFTHCGYGQV